MAGKKKTTEGHRQPRAVPKRAETPSKPRTIDEILRDAWTVADDLFLHRSNRCSAVELLNELASIVPQPEAVIRILQEGQ